MVTFGGSVSVSTYPDLRSVPFQESDYVGSLQPWANKALRVGWPNAANVPLDQRVNPADWPRTTQPAVTPQPQLFILPKALPNMPDAITAQPMIIAPIQDAAPTCLRCLTHDQPSTTVRPVVDKLLPLTQATPVGATPLPVTTEKTPSWLGVLLTVGGAFMTMKGV